MKFSVLWRENHGNFLLFVAILIIVGGGIAMALPRSPVPNPLLFPDASRDRMQDLTENSGENGSSESSTDDGQANADDAFSSQSGPINVLDQKYSVLRIRIDGLDDDRGKVRVALYSNKRFFNQPEMADAKMTLAIDNAVANWEVKVPAGVPVAVNAYHDRNENGELDRNLLGIPIEKYGFSRGARSQRGPPPFEDAAFTPDAGIIEIPLTIW